MSESVHVILVQDRRANQAPRFDCLDSCEGPPPHIHEYRAPAIRPTVTQTAAFKALDERRPDGEAAAD